MPFFPKNPEIFTKLENLAEQVSLSGQLFSKTKLDSTLKRTAHKQREIELYADTLCHELTREVDSTFILPIDREDIRTLANHLDTIIDLIETTTAYLLLYKFKQKNQILSEYSKLIAEITQEVETLISTIKLRSRGMGQLKESIIAVHKLENEADELYRKAMTFLFNKHKNTLTIIKWKDIFQNFESIFDECEKTADLVDEISIKNF